MEDYYCDIEGTNCGRQGDLMRVAHVQLSQSSCLRDWEQKVLSALEFSGMNGFGCQEFSQHWGLGFVYNDCVWCITIIMSSIKPHLAVRIIQVVLLCVNIHLSNS